jgi:hypothetical protein
MPPAQVRFQELEVPTDAQVVLAALRDEVQQAARVVVPPGSLARDLQQAGLAGAAAPRGRSSMDSSGTLLAPAPAGGSAGLA